MIIIQPSGGLCNRLRLINSGWRLARERKERLLVLWNCNPELNCPFEDLFVPVREFRIASIHSVADPRKLFYQKTARSYLTNDEILAHRGADGRLSDEYAQALKSNIYIFTWEQFYPSEDYHLFTPTAEMQARIEELTSRFGDSCVGVHIRRTDNRPAIGKSSTESFTDCMRKELEKDPDTHFYLATDDTLAKGKFISGQCGTYSFYMASGTDVFSSLLANDPNATVAVLPDTVADGFAPYYYEYPSYGMIMGINANSTAEERAAVYMFLNWMIQPDNLNYLQYGIEGETYNTNEAGIKVLNADYTGDAKQSNNNNKDYWCLVQEVQTYGDEAMDLEANKLSLAPAGYEDIIQQSYDICKLKEDKGLITPIFTKAVESSSEYATDLNSLWQEAYVACVTCTPEEFDDLYAEYSQEYLDAGYQEILDEKQALIDEGAVIYPE